MTQEPHSEGGDELDIVGEWRGHGASGGRSRGRQVVGGVAGIVSADEATRP